MDYPNQISNYIILNHNLSMNKIIKKIPMEAAQSKTTNAKK